MIVAKTDIVVASLNLMVTMGCNAQCKHCYLWSSPKEIPLKMTTAEMIGYINDVEKYCTKHLCISGGEPFLMLNELYEPIAMANDKGMQVTIRTNGFWATNQSETRKVLRRLQLFGLTQLGLSYDKFHSPFIVLAKIERIIKACEDLGIPLWVDWCGNESNEELYHLLGRDLLKRIRGWHSVPIEKLGRATTLPDEYFPSYPIETLEYECPPSIECDNLHNGELWIYPNGLVTYGACCWLHPRLLRQKVDCQDWIQELINSVTNDAAIQFLAHKGVGGLIRKAREKHPELLNPSYSGVCEICISLLGELFPEEKIDNKIVATSETELMLIGARL